MPFPNEHACRLIPPDEFRDDSFVRHEVGEGSGKMTLILAKRPGSDTQDTQSIRYDKDLWTATRARAHCETKEGSFEAASEEADAAELHTETLENVELLAVGTWHAHPKDITVTTEMLDALVESYNELKADPAINYDPPLKLGHNDKQKLLQSDGLPSAGWIAGLKRIGNKLVATTVEKVPAKIAALIRAGSYKYPSVELLFDYEFGTKKWPIVLKAAAILGEDPPAVKSINDLLNLYKVEAEESKTTVVIYCGELKGDVPPQEVTIEQLLEMLDNIIQQGELSIKGKRGAPQVRTYLKEVRGKLRGMVKDGTQATENTEGENGMDEATLKRFCELLDLPEGSDETAVMTAVGSMQNRLTTISLSEKKDRAEQLAGLALFCNRITPRQLGWATKYARNDEAGFAAYVETVSPIVDLSELGHAVDVQSTMQDAVTMSDLEKQVSAKLGVDEKDYIETKKVLLAEEVE